MGTKHAGPAGAILVRWDVSAMEALVGFGLQEESFRMFNRKLLASVHYGERTLTHGMAKEVRLAQAEAHQL